MLHVDPWIGFALAALSGFVLSACSTPAAPPAAAIPAISADAQTPIVPAPRPPPPRRAELPPPAPSPQALWKYGHWRWNGQKYVWVPGLYVQRPSPTANWIPDYWEQGPKGWMWVEGQWTS
ncbi:MAG: YXWGXW repeat-containing protein [Alphaproteobacteria bacterium]|nr:YXWGXW repeat-containing protein [Alphaproteobacteria bacterium]MBV9377281.1 YXWGXW repeat-containing protein [Alphaproteobacteria bacterium]